MAESNARWSDEMLDERLFMDSGMLLYMDSGMLLFMDSGISTHGLLRSFIAEHSKNQYGTCEPRILHEEHTYRKANGKLEMFN